MRAFVGVDLNHAWRDALAAGCDEIRFSESGWRDQKWVPSENLHLTLKFLGDISSEHVSVFASDLRVALEGTSAFALPVDQLFAGIPNVRRATMIWSMLADPDGHCAALAAQVEDVADSFGVLPDTRDFSPHITLCRANRPRALRSAASAEDKARNVLASPGGNLSMSVPAVTFFTSTLTRQRPHYERVAVIPLG